MFIVILLLFHLESWDRCDTRMGSKVMPLANFNRNCWREDKTHALYVFSSIDVSTAHVDTISLVKFTFAQTLLIGG